MKRVPCRKRSCSILSKRTSQTISGRIFRDRGKREALRYAFALLPPVGERALVDRLTVPQKDVEGDVARRRFRRELANPGLGWMQAHLHRVELEPAVQLDDNLAIQRRVRRQEVTEL